MIGWANFPPGIQLLNALRGEKALKTYKVPMTTCICPLLAFIRQRTATLVLGALEILKERAHITISLDITREALASFHCPARIEVVAKNPLIILDFAHTVDSMRFLKKALIENFKFRKLILILGFSQDKDLDNILKQIVKEADSIIVTRSKNPRAAPPEDVSQKIEKLCGKHAETVNNVQDAVTTAKQMASTEDMICITGSAYVAREARQAMDIS